jgi:uncharacterized protein YndB with AHSA1/START domain
VPSEQSILAAIASPRRREILRLVWDRELSAGEIHGAMPDVTFGAVSLQLRALLDAGLVEARAEHRNRLYRAKEALVASGGKMPTLPYHLDRAVVIQAAPETVFRFFTDSPRWASWWGPGSTIDARPGGRVYIRHPNGIETLGEVQEILNPERIVFTFGFPSGKPMPPEGSLVTIRLEPHEGGTLLRVMHQFAEESPRDEFVQGWRFQLALFSNAVADEVNANAAGTVDAWFAAWLIADPAARAEAISRIASPGIRFRDRFALIEGADELGGHIAASQRFMPGVRLERKGNVRHCQGTVLADWIARAGDGAERMSGTNVFVFANGKIDSVTGLLGPAS